ncbi:lipopolysaccharide/colanic/teichoic acid biosynthesis glycosyltransferase [Chryseobacterium ginsenosidimutans]|uniref:sugar transferase n=1 Tax=Chryseobacterium ginsenosidimutans TaxID=687846 RepID=UPI0027865A65|nr:sugar transferase [Chryseobacterium ginsenosidimutans]MDQ0593055.1 lipopolysaccharide/colanic/teichoic acid biosynthesis glycosyltransferase [Chryseobacterium ginsenosidimutans]
MGHYRNWKVLIDCILAIFLIILFLPLLIILFIIVSLDTKSNGIFYQKRIGQFGKGFTIYKFKTIDDNKRESSSIGLVLRKFKLDELPQLFNILKCEMSFVGPRPDIEGYYDKLQGASRKILELKPGLTSEASIKYSNEDAILKQQENPLFYNDEIIFPDKVKMNLYYLENMSFANDIKILSKTVFKVFIK